MKWLGGGEGDGIIKVEMDRGPHRTQDDAAVGYVFQRPPDPEFPSFGPKQLRWAHGDDSIIDVSIHLFTLLFNSYIFFKL